MWKVITLIALIHIGYAKKIKLADYCKQGSDHTVCSTECGRSSWCGITKDGFKTLTDEDREMILHRHNELRNEVAEGKWEAKHLKKATNMEVLSYDKELEWIAGCWMKQCTWEHDTNRNRADGTVCGQNLYNHDFSPGQNYKMDKKFWYLGLQVMFDEYKLLKQETIKHFYTDFVGQHGCGHLTALIWGNTKYVGCAKIHYMVGKRDHYFWGCNYAPGGNVVGDKMYTPGDPACAVKNDKYPSLCGTIRPMSDDKFVAPFSLDDAQIIKPNLLLIFFALIIYVSSIFY